jgi:hypothetical protein
MKTAEAGSEMALPFFMEFSKVRESAMLPEKYLSQKVMICKPYMQLCGQISEC